MSQIDDTNKMDGRLLNLIDLADGKGIKLSLPSVVKLMEMGLKIEDFEAVDEARIGNVRANTKKIILELLSMMSQEERKAVEEGESLYSLVMTDGGLSENTVRNLLHPAGIRRQDVEGMDYDTFKELTGGSERLAIYTKLMSSFKVAGGTPTVVSRKVELSTRRLNQVEKELMLRYDEMPDHAPIRVWVEKTGLTEDEIEVGIHRLVSRELLEFTDGWITKRARSLEEIMSENVEEVHKSMLRMRLNGTTLQEIGDHHGITRERIRQIILKELSSIPLTHVIEARRTKYFYENYDLDVHFFEEVLLEKRDVYHFLIEKCKRGTFNKREIYHILDADEKKRLLLSESLFEDADGNAVPLSKMGVVETYFSREGRDQAHIEVHHRRYLEFINRVFEGRDVIQEEYEISERSFEAIAGRIAGCLQSAKRNLRYFELDPVLEEEENIGELLRLEDGVYSARLVFNRHMEYFNTLDIRDYHELHNIIRGNLKLDFIKMRRMPEFSIGVPDKIEWLLLLIDEMGPIHLEEFILRLEEQYGLHAPSTRSLIQAELPEFITSQNELLHDFPELSQREMEFIAGALEDDIYTVAELLERHKSLDDFQHLYLNNRTLHKIGYMLSGGFVVRREIGSAEKYFRHRLLENDYFHSNRQSAVQNTQSYWKVLSDLQSSFDLFRIEEDLYMNISVLEKAGIQKTELAEFRTIVVEHFSGGRYYTAKNIREEIVHPVLDLGFDDIFYVHICRSDDSVKSISIASGIILYQSDERRNLTDFLKMIITDGEDIDVSVRRIEEDYGLRIDHSKVIEKVRGGGMYYSAEMKRIYMDKGRFLDMIYAEKG